MAFPTETVYGLGADALDPAAIAKIFEAKQRPSWDPLIVHIGDEGMLYRLAEVPQYARIRIEKLMAAFWPGPLTLLLPRTSIVPDSVTAGRPLVGLRMPSHAVALQLIRLAGTPIAAPSANRFGHISPTTVAHVLDDLDGRIDAVLDGGPTAVGIESTVLDPLQDPMMIYRPGAVTATMLVEATGCKVTVFSASADTKTEPESLPSPGVGLRHYAPRAKLTLVRAATGSAVTQTLCDAVLSLKQEDEKVGAMLPDGWDAGGADETFALGKWGDNDVFARRLFAGLRSLDARGVTAIVCPVPLGEGVAAALCDRLEKAARKSEG